MLALSVGVMASRFDVGVLSILVAQDNGGIAARQFMAALLVFALVVCAIALGTRVGAFSAPLAAALIVLVAAVGGGALILRVSWRLSDLDRERQQAAAQLYLSEERLELALRGAKMATWDWNVTSGEVIVNRRWPEMRGFRPDEIPQHVDTWISSVHPDDWPRVQKTLTDHFEGRVPEYETEHRVRTKSGEWIWVSRRGKVFDRDQLGRPTRMVGIASTSPVESGSKRSFASRRQGRRASCPSPRMRLSSIDDQQRIVSFNEGAGKHSTWRRRLPNAPPWPLRAGGPYCATRRAVEARDEVMGIVVDYLRNPLAVILMQTTILRRHGPEPNAISRARRGDRTFREADESSDPLFPRRGEHRGRQPCGQMRPRRCRQACSRCGGGPESRSPPRPRSSCSSMWRRPARRLGGSRPTPPGLREPHRQRLKFTRPGGRITVGAAPRDGEVLFWVADTGAGIAAEDVRTCSIGSGKRRRPSVAARGSDSPSSRASSRPTAVASGWRAPRGAGAPSSYDSRRASRAAPASGVNAAQPAARLVGRG